MQAGLTILLGGCSQRVNSLIDRLATFELSLLRSVFLKELV